MLIDVAGELFDERPFADVTVEMICARAGVKGPALYRHFASKTDLLIAVLEDPLERLLTHARDVAARHEDPLTVYEAMVDFHTARVLEGAPATLIFAKNEHSVPDSERRRLRRMMRLYVEEWVDVIATLRPDLSDGQARVVAHGVIAMLNSLVSFQSGLDPQVLASTIRPLGLAAVQPPVDGGSANALARSPRMATDA